MFLPGAAEKDGNASQRSSGSLGPDQRFPRSCRLTARKQFQTVYQQGRRVRSASFTLFGLPNTLGHCRLGLTVGRKVGGAVTRNRIKRRLREVFRRNRAELSPALDLVVNAQPRIVATAPPDLEREFVERFVELVGRFRR